jgi:pyruvate, water dikinase
VSPVPLEAAADPERHGGKAVELGRALRAGLPVPRGVALEVELVDRLVAGDAASRARCLRAVEALAAPRVAVRSSAVGEDSGQASFAGQHLTRLGVPSADELFAAVAAVSSSGSSAAALAYRARLGVPGPPRVAVVVQAMVEADCAGVVFTRDPLSGADLRVVEVSWGLGEAVVAGLVEPDRVRMRRGGQVLEHRVGNKDVAVRAAVGGGTAEIPVALAERRRPCLDPRRLAALEQLVARCEASASGAHDLEFAFAGEALFLLQRRPVTR